MSALDKVCRACLATKESFSYFLFENITADDYYFCTSVQVCDSEEFPKALCDPCFESLNRYLQFKRTCIDSQKTLDGCAKSNDVLDTKEPIGAVVTLEKEHDIAEDTVKTETVSEQSTDEAASEEECIVPTGSEDTARKVRTTRQAKMIDGHKREHTKQGDKPSARSLSCDQCERRFRRQDKLDAHKLQHEGSTPFNCYACNKSFSTPSGLSRHTQDAHERMRLSLARCALCGRVCASRNALREHVRTHAGTTKWVCHVCGKPVSTAVVLKAHLETHNAHRERSHTCEHCGKKFFTHTILQSHILRQHLDNNGRRYICNTCNYPFTDKYNLAKHIVKHEGKKPYKCDIPSCQKAYSTNSTLVEHKRTHSGERPFECGFCLKRFLSKRRLNDHHRIHTGEKPHQCTLCEQRFTQRGTLQRHLKVHKKEVAVT